jgi:formylglycine-generating enzyme required for sulfatase activity
MLQSLAKLTIYEITTATLLFATAALVLIATNSRTARVARRAIRASVASAVGAGLALLQTYGGDKAFTSASVAGQQSPSWKLSQLVANRQAPLAARDSIRDCENCPTVVVVSAGWFTMGAAEFDADARPQERPARAIRLARDFAIGQTEVTVGQFETFLRATGHKVPTCWSTNGGPTAAATCVSWNDAVAYSRWLSSVTGRSYRLPTAAEWEFAARAGSSSPYPVAATADAAPQHVSFGGAPVATSAVGGVSTATASNAPVATGVPNYYGLYDVNGGVAEMTQDCWSATLQAVPADGSALETGASCDARVVKDGIWSEEVSRARFSARRSIAPDKAVTGVGFRVARDLDRGRN